MSFSLKVHHKHPKSGKLVKITPYQMVVSANGGTRYIRDGVEYHPNGDPVNKKAHAKMLQEKASGPYQEEGLKEVAETLKLQEQKLAEKEGSLDKKFEEVDELKKALEDKISELESKGGDHPLGIPEGQNEASEQVAGHDPGKQYPDVVDEAAGETFDDQGAMSPGDFVEDGDL